MNKFSTTNLKWFGVWIILIILNANPTYSQISCQPTSRTIANAKSTNTNLYDDIGVAMTNLLDDGSETAWLFEAGTVFTENGDGTAHIKGTIKQFGDYSQVRRFTVDLTLTGQTYTPPTDSPYNNNGVSTQGWFYYTGMAGTFTGLDGIAGGQLSIAIHMKAFQTGIGANQIPGEPLDEKINGGTGWFEWTILSQPITGLHFTAFNPAKTIADIAFQLSGIPSVPCCDAQAGSVTIANPIITLDKNKADIVGVDNNDSKIPTGYQVKYILTKGDNYIINDVSSTPQFKVKDADRYCIHILVYNPSTFDISKFKKDTSTLTDIANQLIEFGGTVCGSINISGACVTVVPNPCDNDNVPPTLSNCPSDITVTTNSHCGVATWIAPTATDNCDTATLSFVTSPVAGWQNGSCFPIGITTVTYTAKDKKGNEATCSFNIKVVTTCDNLTTKGVIGKTCQNGQVVLGVVEYPIGGTGEIEYQWMKSIYACPDSMQHAIPNATSPQLFVGNVTRTTYYVLCSRRAGCNNWVGESNCITVNPNECDPCNTDKKAPTLSKCPTDISLKTTGTCAVATWVAPTATDDCSTPSVSLTTSPTSGLGIGSCFPIGVTTATYTATDAKGNKASCSFNITVVKENPCADIIGSRKVTSTKTKCGSGVAYAIWYCNEAYEAGSDLKFTEYGNGTADLKGTVTKGGKSYRVEVTFTGRTSTAPSGSPKLELCANAQNTNTSLWAYYTSFTGTFETPNGKVTIARRGPSFQVGKFANLQENTFGASGWFTANGNINGDFNFNLGENESITGARNITSTTDNCGAGHGVKYAMYYCGQFYTAGSDLKFIEYGNGSACIKGTVVKDGRSYRVNVTYTGRTSAAPSGSPKLELCANATNANTQNWYYYTGMTGTIETPNGTVTVCRRGPAFQVGIFGNLQEKVLGASGWFTANGKYEGDFNFNLSDVVSCQDVPTNVTPVCNTQNGKLLHEYWFNHTDWTFPTKIPTTAPSGSDLLNQLCFVPKNNCWKDNYASRTSGYLSVPCTGTYYFNVTGDDYTEFYLSSDRTPSNKKMIAYSKGWTNCDEISKYSTQTSVGIRLEAGVKYYLEVITKEGTGGDHFTVRWKLPNQKCWSVICSQYLSSTCVSTEVVQSAQVREDRIELMATPELHKTRLEWVSNMGDMNDYFVVQKLNEMGEYTDMETINGAFTGEMKYFTTYDSAPTEGDNIYRIKSVLNGGSTLYSENQTVNFSANNAVKIFPNPAVDVIDIDLTSYQGNDVTVVLYNAFGQRIKVLNVDNASNQSYKMDISDVPSGNFLIHVSTSGKRAVSQRLTITK